jgi:hypothetical protein
MTQTANPLKQYFRQPAIYIRLPSNGKFWSSDAITIPPNQEIPVYPMTAVDEITTRTPDALFNGSAMVKIFESCCPNIKDAWQVPSLDVDTLLVAIRIATYGHGMDIGTKCPSCENEDEYQLDLRVVLEKIQSPDYDVPVKVGDLEVYFKPMTYQELNSNSQIQFEDQKLVAMFQNLEIPEEEKLKQLGEAFLKITSLTIKSIAQSIGTIKTPSAQVNEQEFIVEFLNNCEKSAFGAIRDRAIQLKQEAELKPIKIKCTNCSNEYDQNFTLDMSNFFDSNS